MEKLSRRQVLAGGAAAVAATAVPAMQEKPSEAVDRVTKQLSKPIGDEATKILERTIRGNDGSSAARLRFKLPENSEPCFVYPATPAPARKTK